MKKPKILFLSQGDKLNLYICEANPSCGYNFSFLLVEPRNMPKVVKPFVEGPNSMHYEEKGQQSAANQIAGEVERLSQFLQQSNNPEFSMAYIYNNIGQPVIIPLIERCDYDYEQEFQTQTLGKNVVHTTEGKFANLSGQVVNMANVVKQMYEERGYITTKKCGLFGAFTSGVFAGRMAFLEPESFDVCLSMSSNAVQPLPVPEISGVDLPYPLGTADYKEITGKEFNSEEYNKIHQLFTVGDVEENYKYDLDFGDPMLYDSETSLKSAKLLGNTGIQDRQRTMTYIFAQLGIDNVDCVVAEGDHVIDDSKRDLVLGWAIEVLNNPEIYKLSNKQKTDNNEENN